MTLLEKTCLAIRAADENAARQMQQCLDEKTKPPGSLGLLENLACRLAAIYGNVPPALPGKAVVVMAADHGVVEEGVSAYPAEVTEQMLHNFARGGAAINVLARQANVKVVVANMGTRQPPSSGQAEIRNAWIGPGTANFTRGPSMSVPQVEQALHTGIQIADELCASGIGLIGVGEMGIGNTTSASALTAVFTGEKTPQVTGRGTGIDAAALKRKIEIIEKALAVNQPKRLDPVEALAKVGGFELAGLVGVMLGAAAHRVPVMLDGFITGAAAFAAFEICARVRDYLIASHLSVEPGHRLILERLKLRPLLQLDLRLGEGTGAVLAMHLVDAALLIAREMATFASAGVSRSGA